MAPSLDSLEPRVLQILRAPGTDLSTISAKRVRRQLLDLDSTLTPEFLKENKEEIDTIISRVFEQVNSGDIDADDAESSESGSRRKRKGGHDEDDDEEEEEQKRPVKKSKVGKNGKPSADEVFAKKLSTELNGRPSRAGAKSSAKGRSTKKSTKKSAATVDSDGEGGSESGSEKKPKRSGGGGGGFKKEFVLSEPLAAVLEVDKLSRPQVVKQLWVYIKGNELQNPSNKREIMCDSRLKAVFGVDKIDMFAMNKVLGKHLHEPEEAS